MGWFIVLNNCYFFPIIIKQVFHFNNLNTYLIHNKIRERIFLNLISYAEYRKLHYRLARSSNFSAAAGGGGALILRKYQWTASSSECIYKFMCKSYNIRGCITDWLALQTPHLHHRAPRIYCFSPHLRILWDKSQAAPKTETWPF